MSRTDVHRPGWVQERDPVDRRWFVPQHRHFEVSDWDPDARRWLRRFVVPCDLGEYLAAKGAPQTRCRLAYRGGRNIYCGRWCCTSHDAKKAGNRADRTRWRAERQALLGGAEQR